MKTILNRIVWILSILTFITIFSWDSDFFFYALASAAFVRIFISPGFIEEVVEEMSRKETNIFNLDETKKKTTRVKEERIKEQDIVEILELPDTEEDDYKEALAESIKEKPRPFSHLPLEEEIEEEEQPTKLEIFLKDFFAENLLAKIGGILLTLGIIFLMGLVYTKVGQVAKIIIGFVAGFSVYGIGVILDKKGLKTEGLILLGTGILINYVVIFGGRYLLSGVDDASANSFTPFLSIGITFLLLVLNTAFSILTSYIYSSKNILLFSIFFAYFIPILVGSTGSEYSFLVVVFYSVLVSIGALFVSKQKLSLGDEVTSKILLYFSVILGNSLILFAPSGNELAFATKLLGFNITTILVLISSYKSKLSKSTLTFGVIAFLILVLIVLFFLNIVSSLNFLAVAITAFFWLLFSYYLSNKGFGGFYSLGTLLAVFLLYNVVKIKGDLVSFSIFSVTIFGIINYLAPFINKKLRELDSANLILGSLIGIIFVGTNLYRYGTEYIPGVSLGVGFLALAILYFVGGFIAFNSFNALPNKNKDSNLNFIYAFLAIAISLFSISVALLFSNLPIVIAFIWLFEATICYFFAIKLNSKKVFIASNILFAVGLLKLFQVVVIGFNSLDYGDLIGLIFVCISLFLNVFLIRKIDNPAVMLRLTLIRVMHIIGMLLVWGGLITIFDDELSAPQIFLLTAVFLGILLVWANALKDSFLKKAYLMFFVILLFLQTGNAYDRPNATDYNYNYIFTIVSGIILTLELAFFKNSLTKFVAGVFGVYLLTITSIYLYNFTDNAFSLTIYWGVLSLLGVHIGIAKKNIYLRGVALYLLVLTLLKISLYDIWGGNVDSILRIVALVIVGIIMIYMSILYSKNKLSLKDDFGFSITTTD